MTHNVLMSTLNPTHSLTRKASPLKDRIFVIVCTVKNPKRKKLLKVVAEMLRLVYGPQCRRCRHTKCNLPALHNEDVYLPIGRKRTKIQYKNILQYDETIQYNILQYSRV